MHQRTRCRRWLGRGGMLLLLAAAVGCASDGRDSPTATKLKALGDMYLGYAAERNGQGPADEAALKKHIRSMPGFQLQANGIDPNGIDKLFVSDRDNEPFVVLYGLSFKRISGTEAPLVAHEKTGVGGKRLLVYANAKVDVADEARLKQLLADKK